MVSQAFKSPVAESFFLPGLKTLGFHTSRTVYEEEKPRTKIKVGELKTEVMDLKIEESLV